MTHIRLKPSTKEKLNKLDVEGSMDDKINYLIQYRKDTANSSTGKQGVRGHGN